MRSIKAVESIGLTLNESLVHNLFVTPWADNNVYTGSVKVFNNLEHVHTLSIFKTSNPQIKPEYVNNTESEE